MSGDNEEGHAVLSERTTRTLVLLATLRPLIEIELSTRPGPQFIVPVAVEHVRM
jgi:hypothetical protein